MTFFNIFSTKKSTAQSKPKEKIKIIIDFREKNSLVASELSALGFNIEFRSLPVADYLVNNVAIERKTVSDFKSSIINKRIIDQLLHLKQFEKSLLIIEGIDPDIYEGIIHENAFRGFLLSTLLEYKIPIVFTQNSKDTAKYLSILAKKSPKKDFSLRASRIMLTPNQQLQFILEGFPFIGPITAKKLLSEFKTLKNILNAPLENLQKILGKRAIAFKTLIEHFWRSEDNI